MQKRLFQFAVAAALLLLSLALPVCAQVVGLQPTPIGMYTWNEDSGQWNYVASTSTFEPLANVPQAFAFYSYNPTLGQWVPCTSIDACFGGGGGGGMVYPPAGIADSSGTAWNASLGTTGTGSLVALSVNPTFSGLTLGTGTLFDIGPGGSGGSISAAGTAIFGGNVSTLGYFEPSEGFSGSSTQCVEAVYSGGAYSLQGFGGACGASASIEVNGTTASSPANFNGSTPAAGAGYVNAVWQLSGGSISAELPYGTNSAKGVLACDGSTTECSGGIVSALTTSLEMVPTVPPATGQYAVVRPSGCSGSETGGISGGATCSPDNSGGIVYCTAGNINPCSGTMSWTFALPSYILQANITAVYGFSYNQAYGNSLSDSGVPQPLKCSVTGGSPSPIELSPNTGNYWPLQEFQAEYGSVPTVASITCTMSIDASGLYNSQNYSVSSLGLLVYYTGTAPPATLSANVLPPLSFGNQALSLSLPYDFAADTTNTNSYNVTVPAYQSSTNPLNPLSPGMTMHLSVAHANTSTTPTVATNGGQPATIVLPGGGALTAGQLSASVINSLVFDGTDWELQPASSGSFVAAGDLSGTYSSQEVVGILSHALPSLSTGFLEWTGSAWAFGSGGGGVACSGTCTANYVPMFGSGGSSVTNGPLDVQVMTSEYVTDALSLAVNLPAETGSQSWPVIISDTTAWPGSSARFAFETLFGAQPVSSNANSVAVYVGGGGHALSFGGMEVDVNTPGFGFTVQDYDVNPAAVASFMQPDLTPYGYSNSVWLQFGVNNTANNSGYLQFFTISPTASSYISLGVSNSGEHANNSLAIDGNNIVYIPPLDPGSGMSLMCAQHNSSGNTGQLIDCGGVNDTGGTVTAPGNTLFYAANTSGSSTRIASIAYGATGYLSDVRYDGTVSSPTTLQSGDEIGGVNVWGYDGSALLGPTGALRFYANQNWTTSAAGTYAQIATTPNGATSEATVLTFAADAGMYTPSATGGDEGAGTLNTQGLYVNGVAPVLAGGSLFTLGSTAITQGSTASTIAGLTLTAPALGTPASGVITNLTGTCTSCTANAAGSLTGTQTANYIYAAPNGSSGSASFRAMVEADVPVAARGSGWSYCSGTFTASATIYMPGLGQAYSASTCTGTGSTGAGMLMTTSGTMSLLSVVCMTTGVNTSDGVFTIWDRPSGGSNAATALTLTYGTTTAGDVVQDTTHTVSYAAGDLIQVRVGTQTSTTLANCAVSFSK